MMLLLLLLSIVEMAQNTAIAYRRVIKPANQVMKHLYSFLLKDLLS